MKKIALLFVSLLFIFTSCTEPGDENNENGGDPDITGTATISGDAEAGKILTATANDLPETAAAVYHWQRGTGNTFETISSGSVRTYVLHEDDIGCSIRVAVSSAGFRGFIYSAATAIVTSGGGGPGPNPTSVTAQFEALLAMNPPPDRHTITVHANETVNPMILLFYDEPSDILYDVEITLKGAAGANNILTLGDIGPMFFIMPGVTLILENVVLVGRADNEYPVVYIRFGTLIMNDGTVIRGNTNSDDEFLNYQGGGVINYEGTFKMYGGAITGNTGFSGGGVTNFDGTFEMYGGKITGNKADQFGWGGGVHNDRYKSDSIFQMYGGEISGNTAGWGGGVSNWDQFDMQGGVIAANEAYTSYGGGGGIYNAEGAYFFIENGTVYGNETAVSASLRNKSTGDPDAFAALCNRGNAHAVKTVETLVLLTHTLTSTNNTIRVINGELEVTGPIEPPAPTEATGLTVTNVDPKYIGQKARIFIYMEGRWEAFANQPVVSSSTTIEFTWSQSLNHGNWPLRLQFNDNSAETFDKTINLAAGVTTVSFNVFSGGSVTPIDPPVISGKVSSITFTDLPETSGLITLTSYDLQGGINTFTDGSSMTKNTLKYNLDIAPGRYTFELKQLHTPFTVIVRLDCILEEGNCVISYNDLIRITITDLPQSGSMRLFNAVTRDIICNRVTVMDSARSYSYGISTSILQPGSHKLSLELVNSPFTKIVEFNCTLSVGLNSFSYNSVKP